MYYRLFYVWHRSQIGEPELELMIVRAKSVSEAVEKFMESQNEDYVNYLIDLQVKACDNNYID